MAKSFELSKLQKINIGGGALMALGAVIAMFQVSQPKPQAPLCEQRYTGGILFSLARSNGSPLQAEDLQARLGGHDWGLTSNARIVKDEAVPKGYALEIAVKRTAGAPDSDQQERGGIGFTWLPRQLSVANAACLSYSVWMPADFKPGDGGVLPGFLSDAPAEQSGNDNGVDTRATPESEPDQARAKLVPFFSRPHWRSDGRLVINQSLNSGQPGLVMLDPQKSALKPGQWMRIEEEVVLNKPGQNNGTLRVWIDRQLVVERFDIGFRKSDLQSFQGISGDMHYARGNTWAQPPADTKFRLSPLELRLR